eukprot:88789-Hanusia_phi.AAC.1
MLLLPPPLPVLFSSPLPSSSRVSQSALFLPPSRSLLTGFRAPSANFSSRWRRSRRWKSWRDGKRSSGEQEEEQKEEKEKVKEEEKEEAKGKEKEEEVEEEEKEGER